MQQHVDAVPASCPPAWGHQAGVLSLGTVSAVSYSLTEIADRQFIAETAYRYVTAYDERRLDVLADVFTADVTFAVSFSGGAYAQYEGRDIVIKWLSDIMEGQFDQRRHVVGNFIIEELNADHAAITLYLSLFASDTETRVVTTGFYRMELLKADEKWRITYLYDGLDRPF
jgi:SnoaL-like domain